MSQVPELVVVLLCILGAGALVTAFAAFGKMWFGKDEPAERNFNQRSAEQDSYLRRVREINQAGVWGVARQQRREARRQREREASDIEVQSNYSIGGAYHGRGYQGSPSRSHGYGNTPVFANTPTPYYEEEYTGYNPGQAAEYEEQQRPHERSRGNPYLTQQHKPEAAETWREVQR